MTTTTNSELSFDKLKSLDGTEKGVGPQKTKRKPLEYNLGELNKYLRITGKSFDELNDAELKRFANK